MATVVFAEALKNIKERTRFIPDSRYINLCKHFQFNIFLVKLFLVKLIEAQF
jgi:hypothetical protein